MSLNLKDGLNVPQISRDTPLDRIFNDLAAFLSIDEDGDESCVDQLYRKVSTQEATEVEKVETVMHKAVWYLHEIQRLSNKESERLKEDKDPMKRMLITISLHDMKIFNELINLIVVQSIYPCLTEGVGIPLDQRRLKSYGKKSKSTRYRRLRDQKRFKILEEVVQGFETVYKRGGDVSELLMKGSGFTDVLTCLMVLIHEVDKKFLKPFLEMEHRSDTYTLYGTYTSLLQSTSVPQYKQFLISRLTNITIHRTNGVASMIDYVVGLRDNEEVNIEKFNSVNKILLAKPQTMTSWDYFTKIFDQVYDILIRIDRPILVTAVMNFVQVVYDMNKRIIEDFLFKKIWTLLDPKPSEEDTIVTEKQLNDVINVLISLTKESTNKDFLNHLFHRIHLNLWCYHMYLHKRKLEYHKVISNILVSFFTITENNDFLENIILNLINTQGEGWKFQTTLENNLTSIVKCGPLDTEITSSEILEDIDLGLNVIVELLKELSEDMVRTQFGIVLNRWILKQGVETLEQEENPFIMLIDLKFLEKVNEEFKETLINKPESLLGVIKNLFINDPLKTEQEDGDREPDSDDEDSDDEDEENHHTILLELLSAIMSETPPEELTLHQDTLKELSTYLSKQSNPQCQSLHQRIDTFLNGSAPPPSDEHSRDKELFQQAITNINDPLVPIRAHGLYQLRQLIMKKSPVLTLEFVLELHIIQLHDTEPFIYLNVIKSLNELIWFNKEVTLRFLLKFYCNRDEKLDDRLKIGEVLIQFIDKSGEMLTGELVDELLGMTLELVRGKDDDKLRMSGMSLIGEALRVNALGVDKFIQDALDCSMGILELEKEVIVQRAAVVLIADLISFGGLDIVPRGYGAKIKRVLEYVSVQSTDYLLVEQIGKVLDVIKDLFRDKFKPAEMPDQFSAMKI